MKPKSDLTLSGQAGARLHCDQSASRSCQGDAFKEEYEENIQYDDRANQAIGLLRAKTASGQVIAVTSSSVSTPHPLPSQT
ncbi:hypothetical protein HPB52_025558 [Rhipicephalus sanguineus]|uniref:Uncharacterized protein n=1 Tax=Rhipicephalus sanguineus TaxID=34632 RepID=A0A9D4TCW5_RHISA|nr:hypothetical protein HPB52_025558 [Rhipicephalus sanguineus]